MIEDRKVRVDIYRLHYDHPDGTDFEALLDASMRVEREVRRDAYRLDALHRRNKLIFGDLLRTKFHEPAPSRTKRGGESKSLGLAPDEGLGYGTAFLFSRECGYPIVALQSNRNGASASAFEEYFALSSGRPVELALHRVLRRGVYEAVRDKSLIGTFTVKVAAPSPDAMIDDRHSVRQALGIEADFGQEFIELTFSGGRTRRPLNQSKVLRVLKMLGVDKGEVPATVQTLWVKGRDEQGEPLEEINVLNWALHDEDNVQLNPDREAPFPDRRRAVAAVYDRLREEIRRVFRNG